MQGVFFLSGFPPSPRGGGGAFVRAYDLVSSHHALRAWHISRDFAGNESEFFGIMTTMRRDIVHPGADKLRYEIREIATVAKRVALSGIPIVWENIGDPVFKGEVPPTWIKRLSQTLSKRMPPSAIRRPRVLMRPAPISRAKETWKAAYR